MMEKSLALLIWQDLTPLGRYTIGIPLILLAYATVALMAPIVLPLYALTCSHDALVKKYPLLGKDLFPNGLFFSRSV